MADVKWIKIIVDIFDDEKIRLIETLPDADTILIIWFKLITMAGKCNDNGIIYLTRDIPYNEEMLSTIMRRPINTIRLALNEFRKLGMIDIKNDFIALLNWDKHQSLDKMEKIQNDTRLRVQKHREKQKEICNVTVTQCNATDKSRLDKKREEKEYSETVIDLTNYFYNSMTKPTKYLSKTPDLTKWYKHIDDLNRIDKIDFKLIKNVIDFALNDKFWKTNILSTNKLREQFNKLEIQMKSKNPYNHIEDQYPERDGVF